MYYTCGSSNKLRRLLIIDFFAIQQNSPKEIAAYVEILSWVYAMQWIFFYELMDLLRKRFFCLLYSCNIQAFPALSEEKCIGYT